MQMQNLGRHIFIAQQVEPWTHTKNKNMKLTQSYNICNIWFYYVFFTLVAFCDIILVKSLWLADKKTVCNK